MIEELNYNDLKIVLEIKSFLAHQDYSEYNQSIEWNIIRTEKRKYYLFEKNEKGNIIWTCSLLEKNIDGENIIYASRGPVLDYNNSELINRFLKSIEIWAREHNYKKLIINPCIEKRQLINFPNAYKYTITQKNDYERLLDSCKLAIMDIIYDEEKMLSCLPSKFRQNTRRSYRKNLTSRISNTIDFQNFYKLYLETAKRHDFRPHAIEYFYDIYNYFKNNLIFIEVWYNNLPLAMSIDIIYNNKLIYLYGVSSSTNRNLLGMYNLQWEAIKFCIKNKIPKYDFGGVFCEENDVDNKDFGLYNFKKGYCYKGFIDIVPDITIDFSGGIIDD